VVFITTSTEMTTRTFAGRGGGGGGGGAGGAATYGPVVPGSAAVPQVKAGKTVSVMGNLLAVNDGYVESNFILCCFVLTYYILERMAELLSPIRFKAIVSFILTFMHIAVITVKCFYVSNSHCEVWRFS
jgi:hypothetical protein